MEFDGETLGNRRSTPITPDLWIKTTKKLNKSRDQISGYFLGYFQIFAKEKFGGFGGWVDEIREKPKAADTI